MSRDNDALHIETVVRSSGWKEPEGSFHKPAPALVQ